MTELTNIIPIPDAGGVLEILVLASLVYFTINFFQGTRGAAVLTGFIFVLVTLMVVTRVLRLDALNWVLERFSVYLAVAFIVIFQPEIRRALAELGKQHVFTSARDKRDLVEHLVRATFMLSEKKIGALIAIEREIGTRSLQETGTSMDSIVSPELLTSIFFPHAPLHDGGVIIRNERIVAAGCVFPLTSKSELSKALGMRHRAAIGITEETDALVLVVSEETGGVSVAYGGRLSRGLDEERLRRVLSAVLVKRKTSDNRWERVKEQLNLTPEGVAKTEEEKEDGVAS